MPDKTKIIAAATVLLMMAVSGAAFLLFVGQNPQDYARGRLAVFFYNAAEGQLVAELRDLPRGEEEDRINAAMAFFFSGPEDAALTRAWPSDGEFAALTPNFFWEETTLTANMTEFYNDLPPMDEALFRAAFTLTMVGLPYIDSVLFQIGDNEWLESAETIANGRDISPARRTAEDFLLFFTDETGEGLVTTLHAALDVNVHTRMEDILERLIERQNEAGFLPLIPAETRVRDVIIEPDAGFYIDLSSEFHSRFEGTTAQARLMLQSITHTILGNDGSNIPQRVFFLINSERWEDFHGVSDFNLGFAVDETAMLGFVPPLESSHESYEPYEPYESYEYE
ncbi:MAG: GerMN domain-containing protein [Defluviitaleaceae bacterium]|nr:GerMN domain-containing protein [Defluviitaleaceae bacterium]